MCSQGFSQNLDSIIRYIVLTKVNGLKNVMLITFKLIYTYSQLLFQVDSFSKGGNNLIVEVLITSKV